MIMLCMKQRKASKIENSEKAKKNRKMKKKEMTGPGKKRVFILFRRG